MRSGAVRAQCSSQSPTQRAAGFNGVVDLRRVLPPARCSATMAGVANNRSGMSRRTAAIVMISSLRLNRSLIGGLPATIIGGTIVVVNNNLPPFAVTRYDDAEAGEN